MKSSPIGRWSNAESRAIEIQSAPEHKALRRFKRRGRDSNPRYSDEHTGFRNQLDKPLRHLSEWVFVCNEECSLY